MLFLNIFKNAVMAKNNIVVRYYASVTILLLFFILSGSASAGELRLVPSLALKQEYNDNIFFSYSTQRSEHDLISTITPQIEIARKTERIETSFLGKIDQRYYASNTELNAIDQTYRGNLQYALTPRISVGGQGGYIRDSSPDRDVLTTGLIMSTATRNRQNYGFSGNYTISEKTSANLTYNYSKDSWDSAKYTDTETNSLNLGFIHDLSAFFRETKSQANFGFSHYISTGMSVDSYMGTIGISSQLNKLWSISIDGGMRYTHSQYNVLMGKVVFPFIVTWTEEINTYGTAGTGTISLNYKGEKTSATFSLMRDLQTASGQIGTVERTSFSISATKRFTYELSGGFNASYFKNKSSDNELSATQQTDTETFNISSSLRYEFSKDISIESSYTYTKVYNNMYRMDADRNIFMIRLYAQHKLFE